MGAWGQNSFDNDSALDWVDYFEANPTRDVLEEAFDLVLEGEEYLEVDECSAALAAAEIVAALRGRPVADFPENIDVKSLAIKVDEDLEAMALAAVEKVKIYEDSELKQLWEETGDGGADWHAAVQDLIQRIKQS